MAYLLVDILPLKPGKTLDEAISYFDGLKPVFERHGLKRQDKPLKAVNIMLGSLSADMVNLFETANPEASMKGLSSDPEYQAKTKVRDTIFDLEKASIVLTARA